MSLSGRWTHWVITTTSPELWVPTPLQTPDLASTALLPLGHLFYNEQTLPHFQPFSHCLALPWGCHCPAVLSQGQPLICTLRGSGELYLLNSWSSPLRICSPIPLQPSPWPCPASGLHAILTPAWTPQGTYSSLWCTLSTVFPSHELSFLWESFPPCLSWPRTSHVLFMFLILQLILPLYLPIKGCSHFQPSF